MPDGALLWSFDLVPMQLLQLTPLACSGPHLSIAQHGCKIHLLQGGGLPAIFECSHMSWQTVMFSRTGYMGGLRTTEAKCSIHPHKHIFGTTQTKAYVCSWTHCLAAWTVLAGTLVASSMCTTLHILYSITQSCTKLAVLWVSKAEIKQQTERLLCSRCYLGHASRRVNLLAAEGLLHARGWRWWWW